MSHHIAAKPVIALSCAAFVLASCGAVRESRVNPFNWFGGSREVVEEVAPEEVNPLIPDQGIGLFSRADPVDLSVPVQQVTDLRVERTRTGAIILVEGIAARQGAFDLWLEPETEEEEPIDGVLTYTFKAEYPDRATPTGPQSTLTISAARSISAATLANTRVIRVIAQNNARESRRR